MSPEEVTRYLLACVRELNGHGVDAATVAPVLLYMGINEGATAGFTTRDMQTIVAAVMAARKPHR
jgi:hypothetical protein